MNAALLIPILSGLLVGQPKQIPVTNDYSLKLVFSKPTFNPFVPSKDTLRCVLTNHSNQAISVPKTLGKWLEIHGAAVTLYKRRPQGKGINVQQPETTQRIEPGKSAVVFEERLDELFHLNEPKQVRPQARTWYWSWRKRPAPPKSPIHVRRSNEFQPVANFLAYATVNGKRVVSNFSPLHVRTIRPGKTPVELTGSTILIDLKKPSGILRCVVKNNTNDPMKVPAVYDGRLVRLIAKSSVVHKYPVTLLPRKRKQQPVKMIELAPGKERVVFEFGFADILTADKLKKKWEWEWPLRNTPPLTPLQRTTTNLLFQATVTVNGQAYQSDFAPVVVKRPRPTRTK